MGLRCSLLGHDFGDSEVRQEREERGSEVLVTVQEVETCARCGTERVTGENKEVTSIGTPPERPDPAGDPAGAGADAGSATDGSPAGSATGAAPAGAEAGEGSTAPDPAEEDAEIIDADASAPGAAGADETAADADTAGADAGGADAAGVDAAGADAGEDDAVPIREVEAGEQATLDDAAAAASGTDASGEARDADADTAADRDREPGDWPTAPDRSDDDYDPSRGRWPEREDPPRPVHGEGDADAPWPHVDEEADEGFDAEVGGETPDDVEFGGGLTPERRGGDDPDDAEFLDDTELNEQSEATAETVDPADLEAAAREAGADEDRAVDELLEKTADPPSDDGGAGRTPADDTGFARPPGSGDRDRPGRRRTEPLGQLESPVTEYHCPECGYTEESATSSLRAGDICPECRRGYLGERDA